MQKYRNPDRQNTGKTLKIYKM